MYEGTVHAERVADCPFSVAQEYAERYMHDAEHGGENAMLHAGPVRKQVAFRFGTRGDATETGRQHDEIVLNWFAGTRWLPDFTGTLKMRIAAPGTLLILDGRYQPPGGTLGAIFDSLIGKQMARSTADTLLGRIAEMLSETQAEHARQWAKPAEDGAAQNP